MSDFTALPKIFSPTRKKLEVEEMGEILDQLTKANLLIEVPRLIIHQVNESAAALCGYPREKLSRVPLNQLIETIELEPAIYDNGYKVYPDLLLTRLSGEKIPVKLSIKSLRDNSSWALATIDEVNQPEIECFEQDRIRDLWKLLADLMHSVQHLDLENMLLDFLKALLTISGGDVCAIYQLESNQPGLRRAVIKGEEKLLPIVLPPHEIMNLKEPRVWKSDQRSSDSLQRAARQNGFAYLATSALGGSTATIGLLAVGGTKPPPDDLYEAMKVFAASITTILEQVMMLQNYQKELAKQAFDIGTYGSLKEHIQDCFLLLSNTQTIIDINPAALKALGYLRHEIEGKPLDHVLISDHNFDQAIQSIIAGSLYYSLENIVLYRRNGQSFNANIHWIPVMNHNLIDGMIILFEDLTQQETIRNQNEILKQRALLGEVTASFAHEVRNPINNISTGLQVLETTLPADDPNLENVKRLQHDCNRLADLIKSGLMIIKPTDYRIEQLHMGRYLEELIGRWQNRLNRHNIKFEIHIDKRPVMVDADPHALDQVFSNLLNNAIQAMTENNTGVKNYLVIQVHPVVEGGQRSEVEVSISDTGPGIPDEIQERIFEPFFTTRKSGSGIGLAVVKRIVTAHKGSIHVSSTPSGTVFYIRFPASHEKSPNIKE
jgi:two-component system sensor histidine kinase AtoS